MNQRILYKPKTDYTTYMYILLYIYIYIYIYIYMYIPAYDNCLIVYDGYLYTYIHQKIDTVYILVCN